MDIPIVRDSFNYDSAKLRRARRLYGRLIYREVLKNPDIAFVCAQRAIARGLYSPKTGLQSVCSSIIGYAYKNDTGYKGYAFWHKWLDEKGIGSIWFKFGKYGDGRVRRGKPVLRLAA